MIAVGLDFRSCMHLKVTFYGNKTINLLKIDKVLAELSPEFLTKGWGNKAELKWRVAFLTRGV